MAPVEFGSNRSAAEKVRKRIECDSDSDREGGEATEHSGGREIGAASRVWQRCQSSGKRDGGEAKASVIVERRKNVEGRRGSLSTSKEVLNAASTPKYALRCSLSATPRGRKQLRLRRRQRAVFVLGSF